MKSYDVHCFKIIWKGDVDGSIDENLLVMSRSLLTLGDGYTLIHYTTLPTFIEVKNFHNKKLL